MKNEKLRKKFFASLVNPLPPPIRATLLKDDTFIGTFGVTPKFGFRLDNERSVETKSLHKALRAAVSGEKSAKLALNGRPQVHARLGLQKGGSATIRFDKKAFSFVNADLLSVGRKMRMAAVERVLNNRPVTFANEDRWKAIAEKRALTELEFVELATDAEATPEALHERLPKANNLSSGDLMPDDPEYYYRLLAPLRSSANLETFIGDELAIARKTLLDRHPAVGLRRIAFSALWQPLIPFEMLSGIFVEELEVLLSAEDPFSLLFGFELCRARLSGHKGFDGLGVSFLQKLFIDEKRSMDRCNIFSACALLSTISLRRVAKASNAPLFWVRLASLAHAGVLADSLRGMPETEKFLKWASKNFYPAYIWHGVVDRRDAPRWNPEWISPDHLYAELAGRAYGALLSLAEKERPAAWVAAINEAYGRLHESGKLLAASFAGPFDDYRDNQRSSSSDELFREIESRLDGASKLTDVPELAALAYTHRPSELVLKNVSRILGAPLDEPIAEQGELRLLRLCAEIGSNTRNVPIATAVINRSLIMARRPERTEGVTDIFEVMAEACAAYSDHAIYRENLGDAAAKLCFAVDEKNDLQNLCAIFEVLGARDEKLKPSLAKARAVATTKLGRT
jgi:hypothetical protein